MSRSKHTEHSEHSETAVHTAIRAGDLVVGTFVFEFATAGIGRLAAGAGASFVLYDAEHTGWTWETIGTLVATTRGAGADSYVRVPTTDRSEISRALDVGARGVMVPMVESAEQASAIVRWAKYPPVGLRGAAFGLAHDDYVRGDGAAYMRRSNADNLVLTQIETAAGLAAVEEIAAVEGVDVLWVGQYDLTTSMGIPGEFGHPDYLAALDRVATAARTHGKVAGFMAGTPAEAAMLAERGFSMFAYSGDLWIYQDALRAGIDDVRGKAQAGLAAGARNGGKSTRAAK
ncbi:2-dehydro-3-deoxyglucarate aldolase/4-hydroxy-2-oxoheptanedioate aldolase [Actinopolymorpha cephalotaxi]|uniref:2-dehydro-3-deoxyglucarate aldolase/4-hydroxy-2-oxoheptanedioate aldolase n=1 Tax=Actinopolymorpha cephalotaxi TaxID=504797 RepID=A0A1I2LR25_9ACTN|nr:aldolase/citrate lyase family protein [Actinopolymorpha cephalotaxi]NYH81376.1 2-dehydro-3-deoxyglucarate aldolase/4-hydroxy-2-oxoheptanedioate aldolase [Actinopolymorpha cephalotaxi]SFF80869.1 2-dehydro-3-deoxyglucarate aldolase/4-hydroxy-2-oxoheptanedioate aldolase [Actinopolymorpha cephalotaxi]